MPLNELARQVDTLLSGLAGALLLALLGRVGFRTEVARRGLRPFFSLDWLYELPAILAGAVVGKGVAEALATAGLIEIGGWAERATIIVVAYVGLRGVEAAAFAWVARHRVCKREE